MRYASAVADKFTASRVLCWSLLMAIHSYPLFIQFIRCNTGVLTNCILFIVINLLMNTDNSQEMDNGKPTVKVYCSKCPIGVYHVELRCYLLGSILKARKFFFFSKEKTYIYIYIFISFLLKLGDRIAFK